MEDPGVHHLAVNLHHHLIVLPVDHVLCEGKQQVSWPQHVEPGHSTWSPATADPVRHKGAQGASPHTH